MTKDDFVSELLGEIGEGENLPRAPVKRREVAEIPDALVLCIIETVCSYCSATYPHPNIHILGRYDRTHKKIDKWSSIFEMLPREELTITEKAVSCQKCFERCVLRTGEVEV